jgi:hypothetical protein
LNSIIPNESTDLSSRRGSLKQELSDAKAVLEELFSLLEEYGPAWYTEEHHQRIVTALLASGRESGTDT